ncbi:hypothetical protein LI90_4330 (plasmid) [Carbonactinospora thermoautotrophica]|uniref:Uncharacterized protein n=1 Tax=Carbonactinospora thermoautotrophica TaxID=1469144 RepID=A0A132MHP8_9ACTN|nr:hypothetical protein [Carbonactinospora thermoautotrophica]KWW97358.1 hypothetical protein LI90_4330 [Carbonactinospora thermoautotrophica]
MRQTTKTKPTKPLTERQTEALRNARRGRVEAAYPTLRGLQARGLITLRQDQAGRRYGRLTKAGRAEATRLQAEPDLPLNPQPLPELPEPGDGLTPTTAVTAPAPDPRPQAEQAELPSVLTVTVNGREYELHLTDDQTRYLVFPTGGLDAPALGSVRRDGDDWAIAAYGTTRLGILAQQTWTDPTAAAHTLITAVTTPAQRPKPAPRAYRAPQPQTGAQQLAAFPKPDPFGTSLLF